MEVRIYFVIVLSVLDCCHAGKYFPNLQGCFGQRELNRNGRVRAYNNCVFRIKNPFKRPCLRACLIEFYGFIRPPQPSEDNSAELIGSNHSILTADELQTSSRWRHFRALFSDANKALKPARELLKQCGDMMNRIINEEGKRCDEWGPIFQCIDDAVCPSDSVDTKQLKLWPDLTCHYGYNAAPLAHINKKCESQIFLPTEMRCFKACILRRLYVIGLVGEERAIKMFKGQLEEEDEQVEPIKEQCYDKDQKDLCEVLSYDNVLQRDLKRHVDTRCGAYLYRLLIDDRKCDEWGGFFDCVEKALSCGDFARRIVAPASMESMEYDGDEELRFSYTDFHI